MDSVFGIGFPELVLILLIAGIVMGPHRIRQVARWLGYVTAKLQSISRTFMRQLNSELDSLDEGNELRGAMQDVQDLRRQVDDLRRELMAATINPVQQGKAALKEGQDVLQQSIAPPQLRVKMAEGNRATAVSPPAPAVDGTAVPTPVPVPNLIDVPDDPE
ncbi:MAG: twin-arginine translocase TatA/TatE family subunit [Anaerolineales bacterium]|nr:twin-arginine translocase TatA/TatE family subunit [Anaerolineales bacterium]